MDLFFEASPTAASAAPLHALPMCDSVRSFREQQKTRGNSDPTLSPRRG
jgi:hypothetical protein